MEQEVGFEYHFYQQMAQKVGIYRFLGVGDAVGALVLPWVAC